MKILIVSDSHGLTKELERLKEKHGAEVEMFIHCGDSELTADHPAINNFVTVRGNCDAEQRFPYETVVEAGGHRIFVTHGHRYSVKSDLMKLSYRAREVEADIVCFGHSHFLGAEMVYDTLFINPGSIRIPRGRREKTYVILEIHHEAYKLKVYDERHKELRDLESIFPFAHRSSS